MTRSEAIKTILNVLRDEDIALFTTGMISREAFDYNDRTSNFYMIGSMGLVSSVGLGIALNTDRSVFIFDGDGSALMDLGTMALIAAERPANLFHIVLDNECYQSTGNQPTIAEKVDLAAVAVAAGYASVSTVSDTGGLKNEFEKVDGISGPYFLLVKVENGRPEDVSRVEHTPDYLTQRLKEVLE